MPRLFNIHRDVVPEDAVFIGRPSEYGNPFKVEPGRTRFRAICLYEKWVKEQPLMMQKIRDELKGKDLVCFCHPMPCHGDFLLKVANDPSIFDEDIK